MRSKQEARARGQVAEEDERDKEKGGVLGWHLFCSVSWIL